MILNPRLASGPQAKTICRTSEPQTNLSEMELAHDAMKSNKAACMVSGFRLNTTPSILINAKTNLSFFFICAYASSSSIGFLINAQVFQRANSKQARLFLMGCVYAYATTTCVLWHSTKSMFPFAYALAYVRLRFEK